MNTILGSYLSCGFAHSEDAKEIMLDNVNLIQHISRWTRVNTNANAVGKYPKDILYSDEYAGQLIELDIFKVSVGEQDIFFGCQEMKMCWYVFYKFSKLDIDIILNS